MKYIKYKNEIRPVDAFSLVRLDSLNVDYGLEEEIKETSLSLYSYSNGPYIVVRITESPLTIFQKYISFLKNSENIFDVDALIKEDEENVTWVIESDLIYFILLSAKDEKLYNFSRNYIRFEHFENKDLGNLFAAIGMYFKDPNAKVSLTIPRTLIEPKDQSLATYLKQWSWNPKINDFIKEWWHCGISFNSMAQDRIEKGFLDSLRRFTEKNWMKERERIRLKIQSGTHSDEEALKLAKEFEQIKNSYPKIYHDSLHIHTNK